MFRPGIFQNVPTQNRSKYNINKDKIHFQVGVPSWPPHHIYVYINMYTYTIHIQYTHTGEYGGIKYEKINSDESESQHQGYLLQNHPMVYDLLLLDRNKLYPDFLRRISHGV